MLPRWHIILGLLFTLVIWIISPSISLLYLFLVFFASIFIDLDHYIQAVMKNRKFSLSQAFHYHKEMEKTELTERKKGIYRKGDFHLFHTIEFQVVIGLLGYFWQGFFFLFIGMIFHSLLDLFSLLYNDRFYRREYFLINWLRSS